MITGSLWLSQFNQALQPHPVRSQTAPLSSSPMLARKPRNDLTLYTRLSLRTLTSLIAIQRMLGTVTFQLFVQASGNFCRAPFVINAESLHISFIEWKPLQASARTIQ